MSSTRFVATVLALGPHINDSEFRLLMLLAECPLGDGFKASFQFIMDEGDFTYNRIEQTVWNFRHDVRFEFFILTAEGRRLGYNPFDLFCTSEEIDYVRLEWK